MNASAGAEGPVEQALRELLAPLDRHLERGRTVLAAALVLAPAPFILLWLLSVIEAKTAAGWSVLEFGVLVLAGLGWEALMGRFVRWRFDRRFPDGSEARSAALRILGQIETPNKVEEKLLDALGAAGQGFRRRPETEEPPPLLELPPQEPEARPAAPGPAPTAARPGGYYDYIPLEPLGGEEGQEKRP
jgi:hypothetical protein